MMFCFDEVDGAQRHFVDYLARHNLPVEVLPWGRRKRIFACVARLVWIIRANRPCIVHTHDMRPDFVGLLAAGLTGCPLIASNHGWHSIWSGIGRKRRWIDALRVQSLKRFGRLIAVSESVREESIRRGIDAARVTTIYTGIDLDDFTPAVGRDSMRAALGYAPTDVVIGNVARLFPEKGQALLIEAFARVAASLPDARLLIVGDGPLRDSLVAQAVCHGVVHKVRFLEFQDDIASVYAALDVFALSSFSEGAPLVVYKAVAAGVPIVASDVAGVGELLRDGATALLVQIGDVGALARALQRLAADANLRVSMGQRAREVARQDPRFSVVNSVRQLETLYESAV